MSISRSGSAIYIHANGSHGDSSGSGWGFHGMPGRDLDLVVSRNLQTSVITITGADSPIFFHTSEVGLRIIVESRGGDGGSGSRGYDGAAGQNGAQGTPANSYSIGGTGETGGQGERGGDGGNGGNGGMGGRVVVRMPEDDRALLDMFMVYVTGGRGGAGGFGGRGGTGGSGGPGGSDYTWYEQQTRTDFYGSIITDSIQRWHQGGSRGVDGTYGVSGINGDSGLNGQDGTIQFFVADVAVSMPQPQIHEVQPSRVATYTPPPRRQQPQETSRLFQSQPQRKPTFATASAWTAHNDSSNYEDVPLIPGKYEEFWEKIQRCFRCCCCAK